MGDIVMSKVIVIIKENFHQVGRVIKTAQFNGE